MTLLKIPIGPVTTVGQMREKIKDLPDSEVIHWQVAGKDGSAWNLGADAGTAPAGTIFCIVLRHPDLKSLPMDVFKE